MRKEDSRINRIKVSAVAYSLTLITGVAVTLPFVVKSSVAHDLHGSLTNIGYVLSFFMVGMLIAQISNGFIIELISLKTEIFIVLILNIICISAFYFVNSIALLIPVYIVLGLSFGAVVTIPFFIIVHTFEGKARASRINLVDLFFALGSFFFPIIAGHMLSKHFDWKTIYLTTFVIWAFIITLVVFTKLPNLETTDEQGKEIVFSKWEVNVYLVGAAIFFAFVSFMGFNYWVVNFLTEHLKIDIQAASYGVSLFWIFYGGGCLLASYLLKYIQVNKYIIFSIIVALLGYFSIFHAVNKNIMFISISVLGLGCGTIYGSCIALGTLLLEKPSPRLVSFFIFSSGVGTMFAEFYSSYIQGKFGTVFLIRLSAMIMVVVFLIIIYVSISEKIKKTKQAGSLIRT